MDKNVRLAMILFLAILLIHIFFVAPRLAPVKPPQSPVTDSDARAPGTDDPQPVPETPSSDISSEPPPPQAPPELRPAAQEEIPVETGVLENDRIRLAWSNEGAVITTVTLSQYEDPFDEQPLDLLSPAGDDVPGIFAFRLDPGENDYAREPFHVERNPSSVTFTREIRDGLELAKTFTLKENSYLIGVTVELRNSSPNELEIRYGLAGPRDIISESYRGAADLSVVYLETLQKTKLKKLLAAKLKKGSRQETLQYINWVGVVNSYVAAVVETPGFESVKTAVLSQVKNPDNEPPNVAVEFESAAVRIPPGEAVTHQFTMFCGPMKEDILKDYEPLDNLINSSFFSGISRVAMVILRFFHGIPPHNWGLAIIMLTIVVRLALFPLSRRSQIQTQRMQQMQPELKKLQEKHKGNKQKLAEEQMKLWRKHGASPVGGCVMPMLIQLPVFIALFLALRGAIELRKAPFLPWIVTDLSKPDVLFMLGTFPVRILPLVSSGLMFLTQRKNTAAKSDDPKLNEQQKQQKMMMYMMSIFFLFLLYSFPSGLMLYWTVSSAWGILEQYFVKRHLAAVAAQNQSAVRKP